MGGDRWAEKNSTWGTWAFQWELNCSPDSTGRGKPQLPQTLGESVVQTVTEPRATRAL